ncbi:MAG TPA: hypothetical protein VL485_27470 [Ktedonobacteraceae bacterium]|jgi:hypothetical protein|nr:hypothetical protein [Ktedonobacteraceae bacterium]
MKLLTTSPASWEQELGVQDLSEKELVLVTGTHGAPEWRKKKKEDWEWKKKHHKHKKKHDHEKKHDDHDAPA